MENKMKTFLLIMALTLGLSAKMIIVCNPGEGCHPVYVYGDDDKD